MQLEHWSAFIPFLVLFLGLSLTRLPSYVVSFATLIIALGLAALLGQETLVLVHAVLYGAAFAVLPILWVICAAVFTYFVSVRTGAIDTIKRTLANLSGDQHIQAVIIAFSFGGFLEGVAGFGTAVAIPTAMLISIGVPAVRAAVIALVANSVPVAFGALGIPVIALSEVTNLNPAVLTKLVAVQLFPFALLVPAAIVWINNEGFKNSARSTLEAVGIGAAFCVAQTATAFWIGPELVAVFGALGSLLIYALAKKLLRREASQPSGDAPAPGALGRAVANYLILFLLVIITRVLFPAMGVDALKQTPFLVALDIGPHKLKIDWLGTPGTLLFVSTLAGAMLQSVSGRAVMDALLETGKKMRASAMTIVSIVSLAYVMGDTGMIAAAAMVLSQVAGQWYPLFAPAIGGLGTFVTGSDTTSNILLGKLQKETAVELGLSPEWICASNTSGATAGKMISPQSIAVAAGTVGIRDEKAIIQRTVLYCGIYLLALGLFILGYTL